jgi:hypothetical protein
MASTTEGVDDPNRSQRWDPWVEPDRQSVGRGDDMSLVGGAGAAGRWSWTISPDGVSWLCSNCVPIFTRTT